MWNFLSVVILCATAVWFEHRWPRHRRMAAEVEAASAPIEPEIDPIPPELIQVAMLESESWAREAAIKSMYEMYEHTHDWKVVAAQWRPFDPNTLPS